MMEIKKPTLLVDKDKCLKNIEKMWEKAKRSDAAFRPHFKTHFSAEIGSWFKSKGVNKCTVSSVSIAQYFAENGWTDITIAFPYNLLEVKEISDLASKINLNILIEAEESLDHLSKNVSSCVGFFIKIDVGTHRTGVAPCNEQLIEQLIQGASEKAQFKGFLAHAGHTYSHKKEDINKIYEEALKTLTHLKQKFGGIISYGDTPSCSMIADFSLCDEIRPGNFVFYDWMQQDIGSCRIEEIAVCMACPVVAIHSERNEIVVYGGGVHLSKDRILEEGKNCFGKMVTLKKTGWDTTIKGNMVKLSQEHGIIELSPADISRVKLGDLIGVIPIHSCLTADLQGHYLSLEGERIEKAKKS